MHIQMNQYPVLVLNGDYTPKSLYPLSTLNWQDAAKGLFLNKYHRVADYDAYIETQKDIYILPSVIALNEYRQFNQTVPFNRHNIWLRDEGRCAYCRNKLELNEFTFDHVIPQKLGGVTEWTNIVCACQPCNGRKADKLLKKTDLVLHVQPKKPTASEIAKKARSLGRLTPTPEQWIDFIYWETELDP